MVENERNKILKKYKKSIDFEKEKYDIIHRKLRKANAFWNGLKTKNGDKKNEKIYIDTRFKR